MTGSHSKTRSTSTTTLPTWITDQSKNLINESNNINAAGYPSYDGELVAGLNAQEKSAADNQFNNAFSYQPTLNQAGNSASALRDYLTNAGIPSLDNIMSYANNGQSPSTSQIANLYSNTNHVNGNQAINAADTSKNTQASNAYNAVGGVTGLASNDYGNSGASDWTDVTAAKYMSPYVQRALNPQLQVMRQQLQSQQNDINGQAAQANAFGDARSAVASVLANQNADLQMQNTTASGYNTAYQNALNAYNQDNQNRLSAYNNGLSQGNALLNTLTNQQTSNAQLALQGVTQGAAIDSQNYQNQLQGLSTATNANQAQENLNLQGVTANNATQSARTANMEALINALQRQASQTQAQQNTATQAQYGAGLAYQNQQQSQDNASYQQFLNALNYKQQTLQDQLSALDSAKYGTTTSGTSTSTATPSMLSSIVGGASALAGAAGSAMTGGLTNLLK